MGQRQIILISAGALAALVRFSNASNDELQPLDPRVQGELRAVLNHYISHLLGHPPRMYRYLGVSNP